MSWPTEYTDPSDADWAKMMAPRPEPLVWFEPQRRLNTPGEIDARRRLATMPYPEYLHTVHWRQRARRARQLAGQQCQRCGTSSVPLQVHHLTYERRGCEEDADLIVLCRRCHETEHGIVA